MRLASGQFLPGPRPAYLFSRPLNRLEFDPSYPKNPGTFGEYIRKWRMDKGLLIREMAARLGVTGDTVINWEVRGMVPHIRSVMEKVVREVVGIENFFA